jgi:3-hydroxyisobutyrate dehydrogenase-like beta-hydroxyacid dehydrogenase
MTTGGHTFALLHPGAMGVTVGRTLTASGHRVRWLSPGRGDATRQRAESAQLQGFEDLPELLEGADAVVSVCPPAAAVAVAEQVAESGFAGTYLDANAVSPDTARCLEKLFGARLVDGGIVGPPAERSGTTRLYLSGPAAVEAAGWFAAGPLTAVALDGPAGAASALKMCYAAYTKGSTALLLAVRALAQTEGVTSALLDEWSISQPELAKRSEAVARASAAKAWRFVGEMHEIADTFESAQLPGGFHRAAADVYQRMAPLKDADVALADVLACLLAHAGGTD